MKVSIEVRLEVEVTSAGPLALSVAVANPETEQLAVTTATGASLATDEVQLAHRTRMHLVTAPAGGLLVAYRATASPVAVDSAVSAADRLTYLRPSRYCPSDQLAGWAAAEFGSHGSDQARVQAVAGWIHHRVVYEPGTTDAADDALHPLLRGQGVCRDFAHLGVAACRALGVPARYVSVYAPGLQPMDAHAVFEAAIDGRWQVFDATRLAPRASMVRIGTGRDAADVALLSSLGAVVSPPALDLTVVAAPDLPEESPMQPAHLG